MWCEELQRTLGLGTYWKGCDRKLRVCNVQPRKRLHGSGHLELRNIILRLPAIFPWAGHDADTVTFKAQLPVASWLPEALAQGS